MLEATLLVSRDKFAECLQTLVRQRIDAESGRVGLYFERELPSRKGIPHRLFKQPGRAPRSVFGKEPGPAKPVRPYDLDVGGEGVAAQLLTEICQASKGKAIVQPGPDAIRRKKIRRFILVRISSGLASAAGFARLCERGSLIVWWTPGLLRESYC